MNGQWRKLSNEHNGKENQSWSAFFEETEMGHIRRNYLDDLQ